MKCSPVLKFETELGSIKKRKNSFGDQYLAQDILAYMEKRVAKDAYCVMGITLKDIYPGDSWNFVYGWAIYNCHRLDELPYGYKASLQKREHSWA